MAKASSSMMADEVLPVGVGRVPQWWMDITPHYTLDLEEDQQRREGEAQMAYYFAQMAAASDAGMLDENGKPRLGPDGKPLSSWGGGNNGWAGRQVRDGNGGAGGGGAGGGGRNWTPGQGGPIDPKLFGIPESHPHYKDYLTGAKLPPGYLLILEQERNAASGGLHGAGGSGKYGSSGSKPEFKPAWMKKKLRSTNHGSNIRQGVYHDSPNKFVALRQQREEENYNNDQQQHQGAVAAIPSPAVYGSSNNHNNNSNYSEASYEEEPAAPVVAETTTPRKWGAPNKASTPPTAPATPSTPATPSWANRSTTPAAAAAPAPATIPPPAAASATAGGGEYEEEYEEEVYEEEVYEEEEEVYEEEEQEYHGDDGDNDAGGDDVDVADLQAILAAKMAELQRLEAGL